MSYVQSVELTGADAMEKAAAMMSALRSNTPETIGGIPVTIIRDYRSGKALDVNTKCESVIMLPKSNVLEFVLGEQGSVIVRPSGTEPKVKYYYTAIASTESVAKNQMDRMIAQMAK